MGTIFMNPTGAMVRDNLSIAGQLVLNGISQCGAEYFGGAELNILKKSALRGRINYSFAPADANIIINI